MRNDRIRTAAMLLVMLLKSCAGVCHLGHRGFHFFHHDRNQIGWTGLNGVHKVAMSFPGLSQRL
jgi:hypothetical protein